jgi:hypothetical protein
MAIGASKTISWACSGLAALVVLLGTLDTRLPALGARHCFIWRSRPGYQLEAEVSIPDAQPGTKVAVAHASVPVLVTQAAIWRSAIKLRLSIRNAASSYALKVIIEA